jgi:hypothetical protein
MPAALYLRDGIAHATNPLGREFRIDRQRKAFASRAFAGWEIPSVMSQILEAFLQM